MATASNPWYSGRYLDLSFAIEVHPGFDPGLLAGFLDPHCEPLEPNATIAQHFHVGPTHAFPGDFESAQRDHGGSYRVAGPNPSERWYLGDSQVASFGMVQDIYCGLRRIASRQLERALLLHAATIQFNRKTVLLLGNKGSGKSFASYACMLAGAGYLAADKSCVWASPHGLRCAGLIGAIRLSLNDVQQFEDSATHRAVCEQLQAARLDPARVIGSKISLVPAAVCRLLGVRTVAVAQPDALVFLQKPEDTTSLTPLNPSAASRLLSELTLSDHGRADPGLDAASPHSAELCTELARSCSCFRLTGRPSVAWFQTVLPTAR